MTCVLHYIFPKDNGRVLMAVLCAVVVEGEHKEVDLGLKDSMKKNNKLAEDMNKCESKGTEALTPVHECQSLQGSV